MPNNSTLIAFLKPRKLHTEDSQKHRNAKFKLKACKLPNEKGLNLSSVIGDILQDFEPFARKNWDNFIKLV